MAKGKKRRGRLPFQGGLRGLRGRVVGAAKNNLNSILDKVESFEEKGGFSRLMDEALNAPTASGWLVSGTDEKTLRQYYANLEVEYGADLQTVKKSYRRLVRRYHPDKHSDDDERERLATQLTQELTRAYDAIRAYKEKTGQK
jgi:DnaJ-domain-containing protein 1